MVDLALMNDPAKFRRFVLIDQEALQELEAQLDTLFDTLRREVGTAIDAAILDHAQMVEDALAVATALFTKKVED